MPIRNTMLEWIRAITYLVFALALLILGGCALYLFGIPPIYYLVFSLGVAVGVIVALGWFYLFILWRFFAYEEQDDDYLDYVEPSIVSRILPQPHLREAIEQQHCQFVVWRQIGEPSYLQELDRDSLTALFSNSIKDSRVFHSFNEASQYANLVWILYGCQYDVVIETLNIEHEPLEEPERDDEISG